MKRGIFNILFALVLALSLCLVTAVPVAADPGAPSFQGDGKGVVEWSTEQPFNGIYSIRLELPAPIVNEDEARVVFDYDDTLNSLTTMSFDFNLLQSYGWSAYPYMTFSLDMDDNGEADAWGVTGVWEYFVGTLEPGVLGTWYSYTLTDASLVAVTGVKTGGEDPPWYVPPLGIPFSELKSTVQPDGITTWGECTVLEIKVGTGNVGDNAPVDVTVIAFVDDVTINGVPYLLEWTPVSPIQVDDDRVQFPDAPFQTIQGAIDCAIADDTVQVYAGTYNENVVIDKTLTLLGANAGTGVLGTVERGPESIINAQEADMGVNIKGAETVATFNGFTVENFATVGILGGASSATWGPVPDEVHILNNIVKPPTIDPPHNNCIQVGNGATGTVIGNEVIGAILESEEWGGSGILVAFSSNVVVSNNYAHDCELGIAIKGYAEHGGDKPAVNNTIEHNLVENNDCGISPQGNSIGTIISNNDVLNNDVGIGSLAYDYGYPERSTPSGTQVHYNNIVDNENYGVESSVWFWQGYGTVLAEEIDATSNWWGDASGPTHADNPLGIGNEVSDDVDFCPWLPVPKDETSEGTTITEPSYGQDSQEFEGTDTTVDTNGTTGSGDVTVTTSNYDPPEHTGGTTLEMGTGKQALKYVDVKIENNLYSGDICITISYTDDDLTRMGVNEYDLKLYYWDMTAGLWTEANNCSVDTVNNTVSGYIPAEEFTGLPVAPGGGTGPVRNIDTDLCYETIQLAIDDAGEGHTIVVSDGTYTEDLTVNTADLTVKSETGKANTTIELVDGVGIDIQGGGASGFTLGGAEDEGFTILSGATTFNIQLANAPSGVEISYNEIDTTGPASQGISVGAAGAEDLTIIYNDFIAEHGDGSIAAWWGDAAVDVTVSHNKFTGGSYCVQFSGIVGESSISNNTITGCTGAGGIVISNGTGTSGLTISGNKISGCTNGLWFVEECPAGRTAGKMTTVIVTGNTLKSNTTGLKIGASTYILASNFVIVNNHFFKNTPGLRNENAELVTAEYNWWGDVGGPCDDGPDSYVNPYNLDTNGDHVYGKVDYLPWLIRIDLVVDNDNDGWNIVSFPIVSEEGDSEPIEGIAIYYFDSSTQQWGFPPYEPGHEPGPLDAYYVNVTAPISFMYPVSSDATFPSSKEMKVGWNFVGLAQLYEMPVYDALYDIYYVTGQTDLLGYSRVLSPSLNGDIWSSYLRDYETGKMYPTKGYWVFMVNDGVLGGFTQTPIVEVELP